MPSVLSITAARKKFGETQALDGAEMALNKGEWLALLGPNGAGKTTLIRAVTGRVKLDGGSITLLGQPLEAGGSETKSSRASLGIVPQELALYPLLTARENMRVFGELTGVRGATLTSRIDWALQWTGLADRATDRVGTYSGGMKRRLNIACGVLHKPEVVLLDEPTVGVDPQSRQRIWEMLAALRDDGASLMLTTHQLDEAQQVCDRIVIIDHGKTIADGTLDQLVEKTIGRRRLVTMTLDREVDNSVALDGLEVNGRTLRKHVESVAGELPALLKQVDARGLTVSDVRVEAPNLQAVFLHLTGRELRE